MPRAAKLKVFRTSIGFHDAYVAAPSRKAALAAWGAKADLFARGVAEQVDDPNLMQEPLERPGEVVRRSRGTAAEQLAALPPSKPTPSAKRKTASRPRRSRPEPVPRPSRDALDQAEHAIEDAERCHEAELADLTAREAELRAARRNAENAYETDRKRLASAREAERRRYETAMARWRR